MSDICSEHSSWANAVAESGLLRCGALTLAVVRLLVLHALQPASYLLTLQVCWRDLGTLQLWLGGIVAVREVFYLLFTLRCVFANPAFLLVDVQASVAYAEELPLLSGRELRSRASRLGVTREAIEAARADREDRKGALIASILARARVWDFGYCFATMYTLAPEKFVAAALLDKGGLDERGLFGVSWLCNSLCDLCAVAALSVGLQTGAILPPPLACGYIATSVGLLGWIVGLGTGNRHAKELAGTIAGALVLAGGFPFLLSRL